MSDWKLEETSEDSYDVVQGRKTHLRDATMIQVTKYLRKQLKPGQRVYRIEQDGYKFDMTKRFNARMRRR